MNICDAQYPLSVQSSLSSSSVIQKKGGIHYDDLVICNGQGVYKNGISKLQEQINSLNEIKKRNEIVQNGIMLYPNPTSSNIEVQYALDKDETADLIFYDMFGNKVKAITLSNNVLTKTINIEDLRIGLYVYHFITTSGKRYVGKLTIID